MKNLRQTIAVESKQVLSGVFADFFKQFPNTAALRFAAYTIHWNDGDPVYYTVNDCEVELKTLPAVVAKCCGKELAISDAFCSKCGRKQPTLKERQEQLQWQDHYCIDNAEMSEGMKNLDKFLSSCDDILLTTFGDHKRITARAKSAGVVFDIEEYKDHD